MKTDVLQNEKARKELLIGVNLVADVVGSTMGSDGKTALLSFGFGTIPTATKDGISVAASIMMSNEHANVGVMCLKNAGDKTVKEAGDGTSQTIVLARAMIKEGFRHIAHGAQSQSIKRGMDKAINAVVKHVQSLSEPITDEKLLSVATISANNDAELGKLIAEAYYRVGIHGVLNIEMSNTAETYVKVVDGFEFRRGYQHAGYVNNPAKMQVVYENPLIFVANYDIANLKDIQNIISQMVETTCPVIIIAKGIEGEVFSTLLANKIKGGLKICSIKAPNTYQTECLDDIAVLTGATVISDEAGLKLTSATLEHLGTCEKIIVSSDKTTIINGAGDKTKIKEREEEVKVLISQSNDNQVKMVHERRLAQITGSIGVIYVGASGDVEAKEKLDRIDDAVRASKSAIEEGVSVGGGVTLLRCISALDNILCDNDDEKCGVAVVREALEAPARQILQNAGVYHGPLKRRLLKLLRIRQESGLIKEILLAPTNWGYNVKTMKMENLKASGVIDPSKVIRVALQNAASISGSVITSESLIVNMLENR